MKLLSPKDEESLFGTMLNVMRMHHRKERLIRWLEWALLALAIVFLFQFSRGVRDEYNSMKGKLEASELRAKIAEDQLNLMLKNGDCGILLANIITDMGPSQLRLVPHPKGRK